ncbi:GNAT family N-acetyltransferase [Rhodopseudomonas sp. BR0M22]|uniref:GNAT family N-acetyltransferase n=1 Tax=Rhodopseudomonas sp. BR0M22 TaxID=2269369 RepID=UPI0013DF2F54|nr:GNAT family N-acetyltransferase [Rhodopseudomonas sp. BR0M22]NEW92376.1 N-acetyltransferase [Rhodopseudomonas sp. BR0M22]
MLQEIPTTTPSLREARPCVLETERLTLRKPVLADVQAIASLANDRRVVEMTRRMPFPYTRDDAARFVTALTQGHDSVFLIEAEDLEPIGLVGVDWSERDAPELGYWLGVQHWGNGYATEAARAVIDFTFDVHGAKQMISGARVINPASRNVLEKCGFQWTGVELHRFESIGSSTPVDCFRLTRGVWSSLKKWGTTKRRC